MLPQEVQKRAQATLMMKPPSEITPLGPGAHGYMDLFEILKNGERVYIQDGGVFIGWDNEYHPEAIPLYCIRGHNRKGYSQSLDCGMDRRAPAA